MNNILSMLKHYAPNTIVDYDTNSFYDECWIEVGESAGTTDYSNGQAFWFWADARPGYQFIIHPYSQISSSEFGQTAPLEISYSGNSNFAVYAWDSAAYGINRTSTSNSMAANQMSFGMELLGSNGASAPQATFTYPMYEPSPSVWDNCHATDGHGQCDGRDRAAALSPAAHRRADALAPAAGAAHGHCHARTGPLPR
jgi:hypothetical protein